MIGLSKSSLSVFKDCPRCFWLDKNQKLKRPRGIMASIMNGIDDQMKNSVESASAGNVEHPWLAGIPGAIPFRDRAMLKTFQSWRTFQAVVGDIKIWGELDDLIEFPDQGEVAPWDFKSNGSERDWEEYVATYYQTDGDMYHAILEAKGYKCTGKAYFTFLWPTVASGTVVMNYHTQVIDTDPARAIVLANRAAQCLESPIPEQSVSCEYCTFFRNRAMIKA